ncbi:hypothetical protein PC117_g21730 [Phytophthora cactorum]|uniref:Tc1-like transposase DDE domain-containing protein n=1 Tax=Phytophthora cactorum TaxID=29920 RepID=A0A8T1BK30_9STRA|nr:hypothetical protein PC117_g21730 [Phytophthora cactorum]
MVAGKKLSPAEKYLVARTYECIRNKKKEAPKLWKGEVRNHVHESLGIAKSTISAVWGHWEKHHDPEFAENCCCLSERTSLSLYIRLLRLPQRTITPLYHPELQPVELIWAHAKNQVADDPASSMPELKAKIDAEFDTVVSDTWINAYEHVQEFEEKYMQQADACELAANAVDNVDGGVRDAEEGDNTEHDGSDVNDED